MTNGRDNRRSVHPVFVLGSRFINSGIFSGACGNARAFRGGLLPNLACAFKRGPRGEMAEWLKAHAWKACVRETVPWVRIPLSPPFGLCVPASSGTRGREEMAI